MDGERNFKEMRTNMLGGKKKKKIKGWMDDGWRAVRDKGRPERRLTEGRGNEKRRRVLNSFSHSGRNIHKS